MEAHCVGGETCAEGYQVETILGVSLSTFLVCSFALQVASEKYAPKKVVAVKVFFHRVGLLVSLLMGAALVDPHGLHGVYSRKAGAVMSANVTCLLMCNVMAFLYYAVNAIVGLRMERRPLWLLPFLVSACAANFAVVNLCYALMVSLDRERYRGYAYFWLAAVIVALFCVATACVKSLRHAIVKMLAANRDMFVTEQDPRTGRMVRRFRGSGSGSSSGKSRSGSATSNDGVSSDDDDGHRSDDSDTSGSGRTSAATSVSETDDPEARKLRKKRRKERATDARMSNAARQLLLFQVGGTFICLTMVVALVYNGQDKVRHPHAVQYREDPHHYSVLRNSFLWGQFLANILFAWWSWIPLYVFTRPPPEISSAAAAAAGARASSSRRSGRRDRFSSGSSSGGGARVSYGRAPAVVHGDDDDDDKNGEVGGAGRVPAAGAAAANDLAQPLMSDVPPERGGLAPAGESSINHSPDTAPPPHVAVDIEEALQAGGAGQGEERT